MQNEKLSFVTVVYGPELNFLRLQAISFAKMVPADLVDRIVVIVNDDIELLPSVKPEMESLYGPHAEKLIVLHRNEPAAELKHWHHGWRSQQALKMLASKFVSSEYYVTLDAKNHFVRPICHDDFMAPDGKIRTWTASYQHNFRSECFASLSYFGVDAESYLDILPPSTTPVTLRRDSVLQMITAVEQREGYPFELVFFHVNDITEYLLYYGFQLASGVTLTDVYDFGHKLAAVLFPDKVVDGNRFGSVMWQARQSGCFIFALHLRSIPLLDDEQKARIVQFWRDAQLYIDEDEAQCWLSLRAASAGP